MKTIYQCQQVVRDLNLEFIGHHRCSICNVMVGYEFAVASKVLDDPARNGYLPDAMLVGFRGGCGCSELDAVRIDSWDDFARNFNRQTPEIEEELWARFKAGKPLFEETE